MNDLFESSILTSRIYYSFLAVVLLIFIGTGGYIVLEDYNLVDAFYMTMLTMSTVGFEEVKPLSQNGKIFTSILIILSFSTFAYAISVITSYIVSGQFKESILERRMKSRIDHLSGHIIVCGYGRVGRRAAKKLTGYEKEYVVIEIDEDKSNQKPDMHSMHFLYADSTKDQNLLAAGIERASALITTLPKDADNLYVVLTAKELNPKLNIISRASAAESVKKLKIAGANNVIMPDDVGGAHMASLVVNPDIMEFMDYMSVQGAGDVNLEEVILEELDAFPESVAQDKLNVQEGYNLNIIGCKRCNGEIIVNPINLEIKKEDKLFLLGKSTDIQDFISEYS